jgi:hypothetical protein
MRASSGVAARFVLAYLLLVGFWAGGAMSPTAFAWIDPRGGFSEWLGAPAIFGGVADGTGIEAIGAWPGALFTLARAVLSSREDPEGHLRYALGSLLGGIVIPLGLCAAFGMRHAGDVGLRRPPRDLWPLLLLALIALSPIALGLALHPAFTSGLDARLSGSPTFALAVVVGASAEHFFFHGVLLAWLHPSLRFVASNGPLLWPGRAIDGGRANVRQALASLAIPRSTILPCLLSAPLFFAIHIGKPDEELWLSLLAGPVLAWLAFRTGGLIAPLVVHLSASLLAALIVLATRAIGL